MLKRREDCKDDETTVLLRALCNTLVPKLVSEDKELFKSLLSGVFPGAKLLPAEEAELQAEIERLCVSVPDFWR